VQNLTSQLMQSLAARADLQEKLDSLDVKIAGLRNAIGGVQLGQRLEREREAKEQPKE
jgi:hypothetical protein